MALISSSRAIPPTIVPQNTIILRRHREVFRVTFKNLKPRVIHLRRDGPATGELKPREKDNAEIVLHT